MNYTDEQLKNCLAKMLPDALIWDGETTKHNTDRPQEEGWGLCWDSGNPVLDTELLHLCWLVEETLIPGTPPWLHYMRTMQEVILPHSLIHATWQQRVIALAKVKGVEIV